MRVIRNDRRAFYEKTYNVRSSCNYGDMCDWL